MRFLQDFGQPLRPRFSPGAISSGYWENPSAKKEPIRTKKLADLVKRRMGQSYLDYAVDPFISGIYAGDPTKLVTKYAMPKLWKLEQEYGSFIKGAIKKAKLPKPDRDKKATKEVFSAKGGLGNLIKALTEAIGEEHFLLSAETDGKIIRK